MNITILTQSDPFYLAENIRYLIGRMPYHSKIVSSVVFDVSPFGKRETFVQKAKKTLRIFGFRFFAHYTLGYVKSALDPNKKVENVLKAHAIPVIKLDKSVNHKESLELIGAYRPDLLVSIAGNQIFKKPLIDLAPKGCLNLHTALLPKYRGLMPSFWVLKNNEKETGVSVFFVDEGIDSGPILVQKRTSIDEGMTQAALIRKSKRLGMDAIVESIELIHSGDYELIANPESEKTYFTFPTREDVKAFYRAGKRLF